MLLEPNRTLLYTHPAPDPPPLLGQGFWTRAGAYLGDMLVFYVSMYLLAIMVGAALGALCGLLGVTATMDNERSADLFALLILASYAAYFVLGEWLGGATLGKLLFGLRVVRRDGRPCGLGAALLRAIIRPFDQMFFALPAALSMRGPLRQRLGDRAAGTLVVHARELGLVTPRPRWAGLAAAALWAAFQGCGTLIILTLALIA